MGKNNENSGMHYVKRAFASEDADIIKEIRKDKGLEKMSPLPKDRKPFWKELAEEKQIRAKKEFDRYARSISNTAAEGIETVVLNSAYFS